MGVLSQFNRMVNQRSSNHLIPSFDHGTYDLQIPSDLLQKVSLWPFHTRDDGLRRCRLGGYGSPNKIQCLVTWYMGMDIYGYIIYDIWVSTNNTNIMRRSCHL